MNNKKIIRAFTLFVCIILLAETTSLSQAASIPSHKESYLVDSMTYESLAEEEYLSIGSRIETLQEESSTCKACGPGEDCENGCGPGGGGWIDYWVGSVSGFFLDFYFEDICNRHDRCYCHGDATYCKDRDECDQDMCDGMDAACNPLDLICLALNEAACYFIKEKGAEHWCCPETQTCYDYNNLGGEWTCPIENPSIVYVDGSFTGCPQHGTYGKPVTTVSRGAALVAPGGTVIIAAGSYPETPVISKAMTLQASGGTVVIG